jgi:hypothetical protein
MIMLIISLRINPNTETSAAPASKRANNINDNHDQNNRNGGEDPLTTLVKKKPQIKEAIRNIIKGAAITDSTSICRK